MLGGKDWVQGMFREHRNRFGRQRKSGARRMRGLDPAEALYTWRDLQKDVFGRRERSRPSEVIDQQPSRLADDA